ncbi:hypothetical protein PPTG_19300 [Phytophthora nicotianae INRA-310]|uniref:Uncharacterized protein n=1 Tax=Phytophthora nicotianae (strain INRA-310) TaxID=761204 RepID=W2PEU1_PHYN3|nr:hypothetical protein PPTG_19300 [Phytophthora nicotianae INRA-310]ETM98728.1 hypothetical protein PPTG_19300 [Phytophthora nicotianae INRA-310]
MQHNGVLPAINVGAPSVASRGVSPNVAKRAAWSTPRERLAKPDTRTEQRISVSAATPDGALVSRQEQPRSQPTSTSLEDALEVLQEVLLETDDQSDSSRRRETALEEIQRLHAAEEQELERARLAADEQLQTTLELLQAELARERRLRGTGESSKPTTAPSTERKAPNKRQTARLAPHLRNSPFKPRSKDSAAIQERRDESSRESAVFDRDINVDSLRASVQEAKLHELREERAQCQQDYEIMREQVIEEKARQVTLFQRLEMVRRSHARQLSEAEAALRASQTDVERLHALLAQARVSTTHEARRTAALIQSSKTERQRLVCALAETRHKFREWKEGEAATLRATREQAVHALRTEYELKLARHQEEKQKLRDKVKDLEVSLRLLQRDRQLSPGELSERKGTLLHYSVGFGDVGAADFIEAQGRIQELEALLQLSKERQERQDELLRVSETTLARLNQERELDALEDLALPSPAVALALTGEMQAEESDKPSVPEVSTPMPNTPSTPDVMSVRKLERLGSMVAVSAPPSTPNGSPGRRQSTTGATDIEKEVLRRNSIVLSAEVNRYQKIVVQSMEEVRALKEFRRQTRSGSANNSAIVLTAREAYLLEELVALQREIGKMKTKLRKKRKKEKSNTKGLVDGGILGQTEASGDGSSSSSDSDDSSDSSGESDIDRNNEDDSTLESTPLVSQSRMSLIKENGLEEDTAVKMIQTCSKGFLARREFIRKKLAIGKIKARYRGYLVRKNYEALGSSLITTDRKLLPSGLAPESAPDYLLVTEAMQYKMQIVEPHHKVSCAYEGGKSTNEMVDIVLRVSKDPPILQLQVAPSTSVDREAAVPRVAYFHLFETIALLPYEDEEVVLETSNEKEIARIFASRLVVQCKGSDSDYHFFITRTSKQEQESAANTKEDLILGRRPRTLLTELPVQVMELRNTSASSDTFDNVFDEAAPVFGHEVDLDLLIREARTDPLNNGNGRASGEVEVSEDSTARIQRLVRRLSSSSYNNEEQQHRSRSV